MTFWLKILKKFDLICFQKKMLNKERPFSHKVNSLKVTKFSIEFYVNKTAEYVIFYMFDGETRKHRNFLILLLSGEFQSTNNKFAISHVYF